MRHDAATFSNCLFLLQYSIHRSERAHLDALGQECRVRAARSHVKESIAAKNFEDVLAIAARYSTRVESAREGNWRGSIGGNGLCVLRASAIPSGARDIERVARRRSGDII